MGLNKIRLDGMDVGMSFWLDSFGWARLDSFGEKSTKICHQTIRTKPSHGNHMGSMHERLQKAWAKRQVTDVNVKVFYTGIGTTERDPPYISLAQYLYIVESLIAEKMFAGVTSWDEAPLMYFMNEMGANFRT